MVDIFDEVEEDLRAERAARMMKKYGWLIIVMAVAVIGAAIAWQLYVRAQNQADAAAAARYVAAVNAIEGGPADASHADQIPVLEQIIATAPDGYKTLARLHAAGLKAKNNDLPGAEALWNAVAADSDADKLLRDFATLMAAQHEIDHGNPDQIKARLQPLASLDNPWSALAQEQLAILDLRLGKTADARKALQALTVDIMAPAGVRTRASALLAGLNSGGTT
ncbi:MAG TPA: tetratricopeptide repeat protein [Rhodopila sp.]|nr:tetratricopeptide repeat protein [Rhodopila sp.]